MGEFINWLSLKLQHKIGEKLGQGAEGSVFEYSNDKVIKITCINNINLYRILNKNIDGMVKIYHIGHIYVPKRFINERGNLLIKGEKIVKSFLDFKNTPKEIHTINNRVGYVIMEKVDTSKTWDLIEDLIMETSWALERDDLPNIFRKEIDEYPVDNTDTLTYLFEFVKKDYEKIVNYFKNLSYEFPNILYEILNIFHNVNKYYPNWDDIHSGQFGYNRKGKLVVFDVANDNEKFNTPNVIPKNLIKENNEYKDIIKKFRIFLIKSNILKDKMYISYLIDIKSPDVYDYLNIPEYEYLIKIRHIYEDIYFYYLYDENKKSFIDTKNIKGLPRSTTFFVKEMIKHRTKNPSFYDFFSYRESGNAEIEYDYKKIDTFDSDDYIELMNKSDNVLKQINEKFYIFDSNLSNDFKKFLLKYIYNYPNFTKDSLNYNLRKEKSVYYEFKLYNFKFDGKIKDYIIGRYKYDIEFPDVSYILQINETHYNYSDIDYTETQYYLLINNEFINSNDIEIENDINTYWDILYDIDFKFNDIGELEYEYTTDDYLNNQKKVNNVFKELNENTSNKIPKNIKKAFIQFLHNHYGFNDDSNNYDWSNDSGYYYTFNLIKIDDIDSYEDQPDIKNYLKKIKYFIKENKYLYEEGDSTDKDISYYYYDGDKFIDSIKLGVLYDILYDMEDEFPLEDIYTTLMYYDTKKWKENKEKINKSLKIINENNNNNNEELKKIKKAFYKFIVNNKEFNDSIKNYNPDTKSGDYHYFSLLKIDDIDNEKLEKYDIENIKYYIKEYSEVLIDESKVGTGDIEYYYYNTKKNKFINSFKIFNKKINYSLWDKLYDIEESNNDALENLYGEILSYSSDDKIRDIKKMEKSFKKLNESNNIEKLPKDVKKAYLNFIKNGFDEFNKHFDKIDNNKHFILIDGSKFNIEKFDEDIYKYILIEYGLELDGRIGIYFWVYDSNKKKFIDSNLITNDETSSLYYKINSLDYKYDLLNNKKYIINTISINDWNKIQNDVIKSINESNISISKDIKKAYLNFIKNGFKNYNKNFITTRDRTLDSIHYFLINGSKFNITGFEKKDYNYILVEYIHEITGNEIYYWVYDFDKKEFIDSREIFNGITSLYNELDDLNYEVEFEDEKKLLYNDINEWDDVNLKVGNIMKKINESNSIKDVPNYIKKSYLKFIENKFNSINDDDDDYDEYQNNSYYLIDGSYLNIENFDKKYYEYIIVEHGREFQDHFHTHYYIYDPTIEKFINSSNINIGKLELDEEIHHLDYIYDFTNSEKLIHKIDINEWNNIKLKIGNIMKEINEDFDIFPEPNRQKKLEYKDLPKDVKKAYQKYLYESFSTIDSVSGNENQGMTPKNVNIYLIDSIDIYIKGKDGKRNIIEYIIKNDVRWETNYYSPFYASYNNKEKDFENIHQLSYLHSEISKHDKFKKFEDNDFYLIKKFDLNDWNRNKEKVISTMKSINEIKKYNDFI